VPVVFTVINTGLGKERLKRISVLLDSGASSSVINHNVVNRLRIKPDQATVWNTAGGKMSTHGKVRVTFTLPELSPSASVDTTVHVHDRHLSQYNMIIGRYLLKDLGIDVLFSTSTIEWTRMKVSIPMKPYNFSFEEDVYIADSLAVEADSNRTLKLELDRLVKIGVLKRVNRSEWAFPSFINDQTVQFINDLRELNKRIRCMPFPLSKIQDLLLKMEGFTYATALDLNMGYYHIRLDAASKKLCTLVSHGESTKCSAYPWD
jgi:Aspartyl protease